MNRIPPISRIACMTGALLSFLIVASPAADAFRTVYDFSGGADGGDPATALTFDASGAAYGTTAAGGRYGCGTVFKLVPATRGRWSETVLHDFGCNGDGKDPHGGVTLHGGALYGTTVAGGPGGTCDGDGCGEVYEITSQGFRVLYGFTGGTDGFGPGAAVVFNSSGDLFGETPDGGAHAYGTIFELSRRGRAWNKTTIYSFTGKNDGGVGSLGPLLIDTSGNLYGVTEIGGRYGAGTAFELVHQNGSSWKYRLLYAFGGRPDAGSPYGGLVADGRGGFYGTSYYGGRNGQGSIYELHPAVHGRWNENVLYSFTGGRDGALPTSTILNEASELYATTSAGGRPGCSCGTVVRFDAASQKIDVVHAFASTPDGGNPAYGLVAGPDGHFFGTTPVGGQAGAGAVFEFSRNHLL